MRRHHPAATSIYLLAPADQRGVVCKLCASNSNENLAKLNREEAELILIVSYIDDVFYAERYEAPEDAKNGRVHWGRTAKEQKYKSMRWGPIFT